MVAASLAVRQSKTLLAKRIDRFSAWFEVDYFSTVFFYSLARISSLHVIDRLVRLYQ